MTAKRRPQKFASTSTESLLQQCRRLPGTLRNVCQDAARSRYQRHYHPSNPYRRQHIAVDTLMGFGLFVSLLSVLFITFFYQRAVLHQQIELDLRPQLASVRSGDALETTVEVRNNSRQSLFGAYITIPAASGFVVAHTNPAQDAKGRIMLGTIEGRDTVSATISGIAVGEVDSAVRINAVLHYRFSNLESEQEKVVSEAIKLQGSYLSLRMDLPESLAQGKVFPFHVAIHNSAASTSFDNLILVADLPPGWETLDSSAIIDPALGSWNIARIGSLETVEITGHARLTSAAEQDALVTLKLYAAPLGVPHLQAQIQLRPFVFAPSVAARLISYPDSLRLGESAEVVVEIANDEQVTLPDARVHLHAQAGLLNLWAYAEGQWHDGFLDISAGDIASGERKEVVVPLILSSDINPADVFGNNEVGFRWRAELHYGSDQDRWVTVPLNEFIIPLQSDLSVQAVARYASAEGETIGMGPWPPQAGEKTSVWLFLQPRNQINPISGARLQARLPEGVQATGRQSVTAGQALDISSDGIITWAIGDIPDFKSSFEKQGLSAAVEISFIGSEGSTEGQLLVEDITLSGMDTASGVLLSSDADDIYTINVLAK